MRRNDTETMNLFDTLPYLLTTEVRLILCFFLGLALIVIHRWHPDRETAGEDKPTRSNDLSMVYPGQVGLDTYKALVADRIDAPIVTPDSHPSLEEMKQYMDAIQEEGVHELDRV